VWLIEFFKGGIFSSFSTILGFLPSICLMYIFLTVLEDSGLISRLAYALDDMFTSFGLNGKAVYIMLMGLGCNTMATMLSRNMTNKELKTKTAMLNPYVTCMARLPVLVVIASAFFGLYSYLVVAGLYLIGIIIMFVVALILNKTIMKTEDNYFLLEFPPLRGIDVKHVLIETKKNSIELVKRIFTIVLFVGVIVWITLHTTFKFQYTEKVDESILFSFANLISFIFAPIGLNNAGVVCALIVGVLAKELIISTFSIANNVTSTSLLVSSLTSTFSVVHFSFPSAVSFLVFSLLYCPCVSNLAVLKKETDTFTMWLCVVSQFTIAYMLSFFAFQSLSRGVSFAIISLIVIFLIIFSLVLTLKRIKSRKIKCLFCDKCSKKN